MNGRPAQQQVLEAAAAKLWLIDVGFLVWTLDFRLTFRIAGRVWSWDLLNDTLGMLLCAAGLALLSRLSQSDVFRATTGILAVAAAASGAYALLRDLNAAAMAPLAASLPILRWLGLAAITSFCLGVRNFCRAEGNQRAADSWTMTLVLLFLVTTGAQALLALQAATLGSPVQPTLWSTLVFVALNCIPLVHAFLSTGRMYQAHRRGSSQNGPQQQGDCWEKAEQPDHRD